MKKVLEILVWPFQALVTLLFLLVNFVGGIIGILLLIPHKDFLNRYRSFG